MLVMKKCLKTFNQDVKRREENKGPSEYGSDEYFYSNI